MLLMDAQVDCPVQSNLVGLKRVADPFDLTLNAGSGMPLYRQLAQEISGLISKDMIRPGDRLPPTRELAGRLGLNRTTVSAAYAILEDSGLIRGHVGRGSFVAKPLDRPSIVGPDWEAILPPVDSGFGLPAPKSEISFATSRPAADEFPVAQFRRLLKQVIDGPEAVEILQLGSPYGYEPLRRYLLEQSALAGIARPGLPRSGPCFLAR